MCGDVDVVIEPGEANLRRLHEALTGLAVRPEAVPAVHRLREISIATVFSSYGRVDCMLERGRRDWEWLRPGAGHVAVADVQVLVASAADAWALRKPVQEVVTMGQRSGVGLVELAILETLDARRARPGGRAVRCEKLLTALEHEIDLDRDYAYQVLIDLAQSWKLPVPLIEGIGNFGSHGNDRRPALATPKRDCRQSVWSCWLPSAARSRRSRRDDQRQHSPGGHSAAVRPAAIIDAIRQVLHKPRLSGSLITGIVGPPDFITGCTVTGDLAALAAGQHANSACTRGSRSPTPPTSATA